MIFINIIFTTAISLAAANSAVAESDLIYGPEWTFQIVDQISIYGIAMHFTNYCAASGLCRFEEEKFNYNFTYGKIIFNDGFEVTLTKDSGVVELKSTPLSLKKWIQSEKLLQKVIFDNMAQLNLIPDEVNGAGHLNIGLTYFKDKPILLRNFIVDFFNHPGLGVVLNTLVNNERDAKALDQFTQAEQTKFIQQLEKLDAIKNPTIDDIIGTLGWFMRTKMIGMGMRGVHQGPLGPMGDNAYQVEVGPMARLEIRTLRPQASLADFRKVIQIFESRIHYLKNQKNLIRLNKIAPITDGYVALGQYADYLEESNLKLEKFKSLMPKVWQEIPTEHYTRSLKCQILF